MSTCIGYELDLLERKVYVSADYESDVLDRKVYVSVNYETDVLDEKSLRECRHV